MHAHQPRKRFGQNFLQDATVIERIVTAINPKPNEALVEIGPGQGALTVPILKKAGQLTAIELDRDLLQSLIARCQQVGELSLYAADALQFDFATLANHKALRIFGNLPYNISTPLIFHLLDYAPQIVDMHFMLQKEVVARLAAKPGGKDYGRLTVMVQYYCQVEALFTVDATAFHPPPKVTSAIVRLIPHQRLPAVAVDTVLFAEVVRCAFMQRRKTLANSLRALIAPTLWPTLGIDSRKRAEQLSVEDYVLLSNRLKQS